MISVSIMTEEDVPFRKRKLQHVVTKEPRSKSSSAWLKQMKLWLKLLKPRDSAILMFVSRRDTRFVILTSVLCPYLVLVVAVVILMGSMQ